MAGAALAQRLRLGQRPAISNYGAFGPGRVKPRSNAGSQRPADAYPNSTAVAYAQPDAAVVALSIHANTHPAGRIAYGRGHC